MTSGQRAPLLTDTFISWPVVPSVLIHSFSRLCTRLLQVVFVLSWLYFVPDRICGPGKVSAFGGSSKVSDTGCVYVVLPPLISTSPRTREASVSKAQNRLLLRGRSSDYNQNSLWNRSRCISKRELHLKDETQFRPFSSPIHWCTSVKVANISLYLYINQTLSQSQSKFWTKNKQS